MSDWIDITIEKPPVDIVVQCYYKGYNGHDFFAGYLCGETNIIHSFDTGVSFKETTHWKYEVAPNGEAIKQKRPQW